MTDGATGTAGHITLVRLLLVEISISSYEQMLKRFILQKAAPADQKKVVKAVSFDAFSLLDVSAFMVVAAAMVAVAAVVVAVVEVVAAVVVLALVV